MIEELRTNGHELEELLAEARRSLACEAASTKAWLKALDEAVAMNTALSRDIVGELVEVRDENQRRGQPPNLRLQRLIDRLTPMTENGDGVRLKTDYTEGEEEDVTLQGQVHPPPHPRI